MVRSGVELALVGWFGVFLEMGLAVALRGIGALLVVVSGMFFDNLDDEGICGRFGPYDGSDVCISAR